MEQLLRGAQPRRILSVVLVRAQRRRPVNGGPPNHFADLFGGFCPPKKRRSTRSAVVRASSSRSPAKETADLQAGITAALIFEFPLSNFHADSATVSNSRVGPQDSVGFLRLNDQFARGLVVEDGRRQPAAPSDHRRAGFASGNSSARYCPSRVWRIWSVLPESRLHREEVVAERW